VARDARFSEARACSLMATMRILIVPSSSGIIHSQAKQHQAATGIDSPVAPVPLVIEPRERLNKSPLARRRLCGMGCAKGDDANG